MVVVGNRSPTPTYIHAVILPSHLFPPPGSKPHSNLAQRCSGKGPQLHWWHKTISFPCFIHKMGAKQDAQSPLHPCVPSSHEHTLIPSPATCLAQPTHLQKPWCRPFVLTHAKCTPIAKPSPSEVCVFMAGLACRRAAHDGRTRRDKRRRGGQDWACACPNISIPRGRQLSFQLLVQRGSKTFSIGPLQHLPASEGVPDLWRDLR